MASTNQSPFYQRAEQEFLEATNDEDRIACLEIMIKECPKHKSSENMLKNLTLRLKKLKNKSVKQKKAGKSKSSGIKKADMQTLIAGFPNTGKSTFFTLLTEQKAKITPHPFTTQEPQLGIMKYEDAPIQIIDSPSFPNHDKSLINSTDLILLVIDRLEQITESEKYLYRTKAKIIIIFNKSDILSETEKRKITETLRSKHKKFDYFITSEKITPPEINTLKKMMFNKFPTIRIYTKEPKKEATKEPMILKENSTLEEAAEKILKGLSKRIKKARIWGPSSKFGGQSVGLEHKLKDKDTIEFQVK